MSETLNTILNGALFLGFVANGIFAVYYIRKTYNARR